MALTKQEIEEVGFEHSFRGYDVEQVDAFLEHVANGVEELNTVIKNLDEELKALKQEQFEAQQEVEELIEAVEEEPTVEPAADEPEHIDLREQELRAEIEVAKERADAEARRADDLLAEISELKQKLEEKSSLDSAIAEAFIAAQQSADQIKKTAQEESDRIHEEAQKKAQEIVTESLNNKAAAQDEIDALQASAQKFRTEFLNMLDRFSSQAQVEFDALDNLDLSAQDETPEPPATTPAYAVSETVVEEEEESPRLVDSQIPQIDIPSIYPAED